MSELTVIGGGLAGCEAAYAAAGLGLRVTLYEMKPIHYSRAHSLEDLGELVCSNSLKSLAVENAQGLLKEEMKRLDSLVMKAAEHTSLPAGKALAVDRERFARAVTEEVQLAGVKVVRQEVVRIPSNRPIVLATGPLTSDTLSKELQGFFGKENLYFYDAISPIVYKDSVDFSVAFMGSRYGKGGDDYINCPMNRQEYEAFVAELLKAERAEMRDFEALKYFEGCMPVEALAERGERTLAFGPLKPVGFTDPRTGKRPYAVVQLRRENKEDTLYNMVGFQTRLKHSEQKRVFSMIPGLESARFARFGSMHRNSYIDSPSLLTPALSLESDSAFFVAGQLTGVEGYCESAATGIIAGLSAAHWLWQARFEPVPRETMTGALIDYICNLKANNFQPMNANFGLLPPLEGKAKVQAMASKKKKVLLAERALCAIDEWKNKTLATLKGI